MGEGYKCREDVFLHAEKISKIYPGTKDRGERRRKVYPDEDDCRNRTAE